MPLPLIIGAAAAVAAVYGAKKGYDGYQKHSEADDIVQAAKERYDENKASFDEQNEKMETALSHLGEFELEVGRDFSEFQRIADNLLKRLNDNRFNKLEVNIPKIYLKKIESYAYTAVGVLGTIAGGAAAGAAAGFAVYGGVMALGAASTGTAISALSGAAATNAALAAIGGGSLATGGLGMAGGAAILNAAICAPVLAIAGWAYDNHGEKSLNNAYKIKEEVAAAVSKFRKSTSFLLDVSAYVNKVESALLSIYAQFDVYSSALKDVDAFIRDLDDRGVDVDAQLNNLGDSLMRIIENGYALASILVDLMMTPIFKLKEVNGEVVKNDKGVPEALLDENGSMILNAENLNSAIEVANSKAHQVK